MRTSFRHTLPSAGCNAAARGVLATSRTLRVRSSAAALRPARFARQADSSAARRTS